MSKVLLDREDCDDREICPQCEETILSTRQVDQDITIAGSVIRLRNVQVEECLQCGFRSLSGKEAGLFDLMFAPEYSEVGDLIEALRRAGYYGMFLKESHTETSLAFGSQQYVACLDDDLKQLYLDNESFHVLTNLAATPLKGCPVELNGQLYTVQIPKLGEGENGVVFAYREDEQTVLKIAKPRPYSREHLQEEYAVTRIFDGEGIPVPRILAADPYGRYMIKERLAGESLARLYPSLGSAEAPRHRLVFEAVARFVARLLELFGRYPAAKTSISPNNIFVLLGEDDCRCLLVDTGPAPCHDYSQFDFGEYWNKVIPQKIERYRAVGYL
ncbi:MAG: phosphotransferase [Syntrophobacteraceae bacterium]